MSETNYSLNDLIESLIFKATKDGIITEDEQNLINQVQIDLENLETSVREANENAETRDVIEKIFKTSSANLIQNAISVARKDTNMSKDEKELIDELFSQFGWDYSDWQSRNWFVFKICIEVDETTNTREMLEVFDKVFCLWKLSNFQLKTGICLGTKHFVIDDNDVTLLAFGLHPENSRPWVRKGAFAFLNYKDPTEFQIQLKETAETLLNEFYERQKALVS